MANNGKYMPIIKIGNVLVSPDLFTERFCCDLDVCRGECCVEGDAGAPVTLDEVAEMENVLDTVWNDLSAAAQAEIDRRGVAYTDEEGDLVTSIVAGKDCVFTCYENGCCLCALERAFRRGGSSFCKPMSCSLYPLRERVFRDGTVGLNYHRWKVCDCARKKGVELDIPLYRFLRQPLIRRFGEEWYKELEEVGEEMFNNE